MLQNSSILKIARIFFDEPTKDHYLMEISRKANIAHTSVMKQLVTLKKKKLIVETQERKGKRIFPIYKANLDSYEFKKNKQFMNQYMLESSGLVNHLKNKLVPRSIVLFGSYQRGEDTEDSDVDIFIEGAKTELKLEKYENILKRKIELHFKKNFKDFPNELKNNIVNGSVLSGYLGAF